ncbi:MAG: uracil-DNA glycosylase family protein [Pseudomonadota bacterium]
MNGAESLDELSAAIAACRVCVEQPDGAPLPHKPRPVAYLSQTARICICGQAPGNKVHQSGVPFSDPSGDRLRDWMGVDKETFYDRSRVAIVPMGFCFPGLDAKGGDLPPRRECGRTWHDRIFQAMPPAGLVLIIGQYAQAYHLGAARKKTLTETVLNWRSYLDGASGQVRLVLPHPSWRNTAWLKRNPWFETEVLPVLRREVAARL